MPTFNMHLDIVYEDDDILVLNKPSGISVHRTGPKDPNRSLVDFVLEKYPQIKDVGDDKILRPGIVHRLDKETSGLMVVAKNQKSFDYLKNLFQKRLIKKTYLALVYGRPKNKKGRIELPLGKLGTRQTTVLKGKKELKERDAITDYEVIKEFPNYSLLEVSPKTGRTHQIRVHLKSIGHPLVCDPIYGGKMKLCPPELGRLFLHAQKLELTLPSGQNIVLEADPPKELTDFLNSSIIMR